LTFKTNITIDLRYNHLRSCHASDYLFFITYKSLHSRTLTSLCSCSNYNHYTVEHLLVYVHALTTIITQ